MKSIGVLLFPLLLIVLITSVTKYLWSFLVVRLFPGAVEQNLVAKDISWGVSVILAIMFLMLSAN